MDETVPELMLVAEAAYAAGQLEATLETLERAHAESLRSGDAIGAAAAATRLAMHLIIDTGLMAPVRAWLKRSERLLDGLGDTPVHAWLAVGRACERMLSGDFAGGRDWAQKAIDAGDRHGDASAATFGRNVYARCLIFDGDIERGLVLLEDVAGCLLTGELDPLTTGLLYCEVVCAWQGVARYDLAEEWTDAMERFSRDHAIGSVNGRCRVHRAEILRLRGELPDAERAALEACEQLRPYMRYEFGWPLTELGRIRQTRGDTDGAEEAFVEAHEMGWDPQPSLALLRLEQGDVAGAVASIHDALERPVNAPSKERPPNSELSRAPLLEAQVEIAIAAGEVDVARKACDELGHIAATFGSKALDAGYALASGRVNLAEGDAAGARRDLQNAVRLWSEINAPYEAAIARTVLAQAHRVEGNEQGAALEDQAARSTFERLGAQHSAGPAPHPVADSAKDLTEFRREGDYWSIAFARRTVRLRDLKGLHYLARMLAEPGREFLALDLITAGSPDPRVHERDLHTGLGDIGPMLDADAKASYRRRLAEIDEDIEDARAVGDEVRAARASAERDFVVRELSRAVGLGGRDRQMDSASERARVAVTRAVRHALRRVGEQHPQLGAHLEHAVQTGTYCSYRPDPLAPVSWTT